MNLVIFLTICISILHNGWAHDNVVLTTCGKIRGSVLQTRNGEDFYAFQGIPYGEPPIGKLRFQVPLPKEPWPEDIMDATKPGNMCYQTRPQFRLLMSEDCLQLNIYTKSLSTSSNQPVMVYLHGGGLFMGSGVSLIFGPEYLMDHDVVIVTINYRLGLFGFLATGTQEAPGNMGFKDQVLALKWIRDNIKQFGGDPNSVTIFGQSAGARSTVVHMASPMSTGLFHRAIIISGSTIVQWKIPNNQSDLAEIIGNYLNCSSISPPSNLVDCLRNVPAWDLANSLFSRDKFHDIDNQQILIVFPIVEPDFGQQRFLLEDPQVTFKSGKFNKVPVIIGVTQDEFIEYAYKILARKVSVDKFNSDFHEFYPVCFYYEKENEPRKSNITNTLRLEYLKNEQFSESNVQDVGNLIFDAMLFGVHRFVHLVAPSLPVFYYKFTYGGRYSHFNYPGKKYVVHIDDLQYLFHLRYLPMINVTDPENRMVEMMTSMWTHFARFATPNYNEKLNWTRYNIRDENYLNIGEHSVMETKLFLERFSVWDRLFPIP